MWRSGLREQREHKEGEKYEHSQSDPEPDDDGVWNERGESHDGSFVIDGLSAFPSAALITDPLIWFQEITNYNKTGPPRVFLKFNLSSFLLLKDCFSY